jgi:hypothetical protein
LVLITHLFFAEVSRLIASVGEKLPHDGRLGQSFFNLGAPSFRPLWIEPLASEFSVARHGNRRALLISAVGYNRA